MAPAAEAYLATGEFDADRMLGVLTHQIAQAAREGHRGLRMSADMSWALRPVAGLQQLPGYESRAGRLLSQASATAVCQYDRRSFDTVTLADVTAVHGRAIAAVTSALGNP
jgi:hypothetical protein